MARPCDSHPPFDPQPKPKRPEAVPDPIPERTVETVQLVFGPRGRFAGFKSTFTTEPIEPRK